MQVHVFDRREIKLPLCYNMGYGGELLRSNPGSIINICVRQNPDNTTTFQRMYICFKAIKMDGSLVIVGLMD